MLLTILRIMDFVLLFFWPQFEANPLARLGFPITYLLSVGPALVLDFLLAFYKKDEWMRYIIKVSYFIICLIYILILLNNLFIIIEFGGY